MFVSKAAVVGAGTMGGEIAQAIASSDIPVVLKDIDQKFVDHGLEKAREVTKGQLDRLEGQVGLAAGHGRGQGGGQGRGGDPGQAGRDRPGPAPPVAGVVRRLLAHPVTGSVSSGRRSR